MKYPYHLVNDDQRKAFDLANTFLRKSLVLGLANFGGSNVLKNCTGYKDDYFRCSNAFVDKLVNKDIRFWILLGPHGGRASARLIFDPIHAYSFDQAPCSKKFRKDCGFLIAPSDYVKRRGSANDLDYTTNWWWHTSSLMKVEFDAAKDYLKSEYRKERYGI